MGSPVTSSLLKAVSKGFVEIPGLTTTILRRHPHSKATAIGHLDLTRQGLSNTTLPGSRQTPVRTIIATQEQDDEDAFPVQPIMHDNSERKPIFVKTITLDKTYGDSTGRFPWTAMSGAQYMLILYTEDANYIHVEPMQNRKASEYIRAYGRALDFFKRHDIKPSLLRMDNEISNALEAYLVDTRQVPIQYVAPNNHRQNKAERVIRVWKNHFISILATTDPDFPMHAWEELLAHAELTVNLLRASNTNTSISAWEHVRGKFVFQDTPIAPPGTPVLVYESPHNRGSWAPHGVPGFYVGPALAHYRCYTVFVPKTCKTRVTDTLSWHPKSLVVPGTSAVEAVTAAAKDLESALLKLRKSKPFTATMRQPFDNMESTLTATLNDMCELFPTTAASANTGNADLEPFAATNPVQPSQRVATPAEQPQSQRVAPAIEQQSQRVTPSVEQHNNPGLQACETKMDNCLINGLKNASPLTNKPKYSQHKKKGPRQHTASQASPHKLHNMRKSSRDRRSDYNHHELPRIHSAFTSITMNSDGKALKWHSASKGIDAEKWHLAADAEFDRLIETTKTMHLIPWDQKPANRQASYYNPQLKIKSNGTYRCRGTYGGNRSDYAGPKIAETAELTTVKMLINACISDPDSEFMTADISDFYLGTPLDTPEYMIIRLDQMPEASRRKYIYDPSLIRNGCILVEIIRSLYGLPQAGRLSQQRLIRHLETHGYKQATHTPCLFAHIDRPVSFTLIVDDFGIKYTGRQHADHLLATLRLLYPITVNWTGDKYIGYTIKWDRPNRRVHLSMSGYVSKALTRFGIQKPTRPVNAPTRYIPPSYGTRVQTPYVDSTSTISQERAHRIQEIVGVFLYLARALDHTHLHAVTRVAALQSRPTEAVAAAAEQLLHYAATWPEAELVYHASDMVLRVHSDASFNSEPNARSRAGGFFYLGDHSAPDLINGGILANSKVISSVVCAASEAEYGSLFKNGQAAAPLRYTLADLGHPQQQPTPITTDNSVAAGIANDTVTQRRSKATDMRFHWIRDRVRQGQFAVIWKPGHQNLADYFTKVHPVQHFLAMRRFFIHTPGQKLTRLTLNDLPHPAGPSTSKTI